MARQTKVSDTALHIHTHIHHLVAINILYLHVTHRYHDYKMTCTVIEDAIQIVCPCAQMASISATFIQAHLQFYLYFNQ